MIVLMPESVSLVFSDIYLMYPRSLNRVKTRWASTVAARQDKLFVVPFARHSFEIAAGDLAAAFTMAREGFLLTRLRVSEARP